MEACVDVWLNNIFFGKKWFYESCPSENCRKAVEAKKICPKCFHYVEKSIKRFTLSVELSDPTGSLFATAFDESADILLRHKPIEEILDLTDEARHILNTKLVYENYVIKIISRKDSDGKVQHTIQGRPELIQKEQHIQMNFKRIDELMKEKQNFTFLSHIN